MSGGSSNHFRDQRVDDLHQNIHDGPGNKGKGCLTRCNGQNRGREEDNLCSHIWQAYVKAQDYPEMYNYPAYKSLCGEGVFRSAARVSKRGKCYPSRYAMKHRFPFKKKPRPGQWDLGIKRNFQHFLKPWWHNAHHIIPNSTLRKAISKASESDSRLYNLIRGGLLMGSYNLNDKVNMVILPMGEEVANSIGLPRHLKGHEAGPNESKKYFNHPDYNARVKIRLSPVIDSYKSIAQQALEDHPGVPKKIAADQLDQISKVIFVSLRKAGPFLRGSLDKLKFPTFPRVGA